MCARALGTYVPSYSGRPVRLFFMLETHGPIGTHGIRDSVRAHLTREARSGAI
jgi:hypothetical protein